MIHIIEVPSPVGTRSKARVCGRSVAVIVGSNTTVGMDVCMYVWGTLWRSWLRHCATSRKVAGSIPDGVIGIFH